MAVNCQVKRMLGKKRRGVPISGSDGAKLVFEDLTEAGVLVRPELAFLSVVIEDRLKFESVISSFILSSTPSPRQSIKS